jgi:pimeloyl-ACP methyl ester carboxylesterase
MLTERQFDTGAVTLNFVEGPAGGAPLVLVHGLSYRWQSWLPVMPTLALRWQLYALDLRGFGRSGRAPGAYRAVDYAQDVVAFLRGVVGRPAAVVAHSLGAVVAVAVAAEAPELVRALALEEPPLGIFGEESMRGRREYEAYRRQRDLALGGPSLDEAVTQLGQLMPSADPVEVRSRAVALLQRDPEVVTFFLEDRAKEGLELDRRLGRISCPVLLLQGNVALGGALEDERAARARSLLADCSFRHFPEVGHGIHAEEPFAFCRVVADFVGALG